MIYQRNKKFDNFSFNFLFTKCTFIFPFTLTSILNFKPMNLPAVKSLFLGLTGGGDPDDL